ncbi:hypothetical protein [Synechocystis sp. LKSZ1]|uniref:hypothetical protein n=1 Tax=Synechocystis sp. LKSZ1 TaxID=3144951 RepID=UPI00336BDBE6
MARQNNQFKQFLAKFLPPFLFLCSLICFLVLPSILAMAISSEVIPFAWMAGGVFFLLGLYTLLRGSFQKK